MRTIAYVDGFNLYYGCLKGTPYKWLDLSGLLDFLLPKNEIVAVRYFTARISGTPHDPDRPARQDRYLQALTNDRRIQIVEGSFLVKHKRMPLVAPAPGAPRTAEVIVTEEKGSDVNLAAHLVHDGHLGRYDVAVVVSNDSDFAQAIRLVTGEIGKPVGVINPHRRASIELQRCASFMRSIRPSALRRCQLPDVVRGPRHAIHKPRGW